MSETKKLFCEELKFRLDTWVKPRKGFDLASLKKRAAAKAGLAPADLQTCIRKNTFSKSRISSLGAAIGWEITPDSVEQNFEINWAMEEFSVHVERWIKKVRIKKSSLALQLGIKRANLLKMIKQNRFDREIVARLINEMDLGIDTANLEQHYCIFWANEKNNTSSLNETFKEMDKQLDRVIAQLHRHFSESAGFMDLLQEGDFLVAITSSVEPYYCRLQTEFGKRVAEKLAQAVGRGALLIQLAPHQSLVTSYEKDHGFDRVVSSEQFVRDFAAFREFAVGILNPLHGEEKARQDITERTAIQLFDNCPVVMPGMIITLVGSLQRRPSNSVAVRLMMRLPGDRMNVHHREADGALLLYPEYDLFQDRVRRYVTRFLQDRLKEIPEQERMPVEKVLALLNEVDSVLDSIRRSDAEQESTQ